MYIKALFPKSQEATLGPKAMHCLPYAQPQSPMKPYPHDFHRKLSNFPSDKSTIPKMSS